jgi:serine/threonine protein kinase/tetratricopeptide (TPR) repeat protein
VNSFADEISVVTEIDDLMRPISAIPALLELLHEDCPRGRSFGRVRTEASRFNCCSLGVTSDNILRSKKERERVSDSPAMISAPRLCPKCGAEIPADAPEGGCPGCLFENGLGLHQDGSVTVRDSSAAAVAWANADAAADARHSKKAARAAEMLGELGDYELLEEVGRGGQGVVFRARQKSLNRTVALKVISLGQWASKTYLKRFRLEAEAAARLEHPGIVPIHEVGEHDGSCYFSMKFVEGGQLDEVVRRKPMSLRQAAELIAKVARTVHYAHEHGILHRDIKPGNILLDEKGEPHLTDFGLARLVESESTLTRTKEVMGTPSYLAPEQAMGDNATVSSATDVYGLGAVFYQLLTGHPPFAGGTTYETIKLVLDTEPRQPRSLNPKIDRDLSTICLKCLDKDPQHRYPSALALAEDLERWLKHEPIQARRSGVFARGKKWVQRNPARALSAASLIALAVATGWIIWKSELVRQPISTGIAVLPFENLNHEKENSVFADGVQDDILTKLAKIADLKVISRTSVMEYRGKRNIRQIGDVLRVSHVLEGSARRSGDRIYLNAQLIDTRTDTHVWAEQYDRDLNDMFAIQSEIAQRVAQHLHAKLSTSEKASIEEKPTQDLVAYDFYVRAVSMIYNAQVPFDEELVNRSEAVDLLNQAVARDPNFLLAYCQLAFVHDLVYQEGKDQTPARLALGQSAIDSAFRLRPDSGEAHLALAWHLFWGYADYDRARAELALAQQSLPNNPQVYQLAGSMDRSQGRWADAIHNLERACELDPRNLAYLINLSSTYMWLHDYDQHAKVMDRIIALHPERRPARMWRAHVELARRADTAPLRAILEKVLTNEPGSEKDPFVAGFRYTLALYDRDLDAAGRAAVGLSEKNSLEWSHPALGRDFWVGVIARLKGDETSARAAFMRARAQQEEEMRGHPDRIVLLSELGLIDAALGRKEEALSEGRRAMELAPSVKDSFTEPYVELCFAITCAWTGERELALGQLEALTKAPGYHTYGYFRLSPMWDPLRGDPRFEKILASLAPKETVSK